MALIAGDRSVERLNKQLNDQWISRRAGNTVDYIERRKYSKGHRPEDLAELSLQDLFNEIEVYRQLYNQTVLGSEAASPAYRFQQGLEKFDFSGVSIKINDEFLLVTAYDTDHQFYKIGPGGDLVFNCLHFHHPELRRLRPKRSHTELRVDPEDPYRVYCLIDGKWETALNSGHQKFMAKSTVERQAESFRVAEGRSLRDMAKQNGNDEKARAMTTFDESYHERTVDERIVKTSQTVKKESDISLDSTDLFERLKLKSLRDLESEKL